MFNGNLEFTIDGGKPLGHFLFCEEKNIFLKSFTTIFESYVGVNTNDYTFQLKGGKIVSEMINGTLYKTSVYTLESQGNHHVVIETVSEKYKSIISKGEWKKDFKKQL